MVSSDRHIHIFRNKCWDSRVNSQFEMSAHTHVTLAGQSTSTKTGSSVILWSICFTLLPLTSHWVDCVQSASATSVLCTCLVGYSKPELLAPTWYWTGSVYVRKSQRYHFVDISTLLPLTSHWIRSVYEWTLHRHHFVNIYYVTSSDVTLNK